MIDIGNVIRKFFENFDIDVLTSGDCLLNICFGVNFYNLLLHILLLMFLYVLLQPY